MSLRPARLRAFTLLEMMLAIALASIVALSAYGLFEIIRRSERRQALRLGETDEIARAYRTIEASLRTLVMSDKPIPGDEKAVSERLRAFERAVDNDEPDPPLEQDEPEPRLILRPDPASPVFEVDIDGGRHRLKGQVMEVVVRSPPVLGAKPDSRIFEVASRRARDAGDRAESRRQREREREADADEDGEDADGPAAEGDDGELEEDELPPLAPGVRGVFELVPDGIDPLGALGPATGLEGWRPRETSEPGLTLWWRELPPPPIEDEEDEPARVDAQGNPIEAPDSDVQPRRSREDIDAEQRLLLASARRVPLITGLRWMKWEVFRGKRFDTRTRATWIAELPAFVKVAFETVEGRKENWMFEVAWTQGPEPGTPVDVSTLRGRTPPGLNQRNRTENGRNRDTGGSRGDRTNGETGK